MNVGVLTHATAMGFGVLAALAGNVFITEYPPQDDHTSLGLAFASPLRFERHSPAFTI